MNKSEALDLLKKIRDGAVSPEDALLRMRAAPFEDLGFAKVDHHRGLRQGVAEVIYGAGKTPEQIAGIAAAMHSGEGGRKPVIITRIHPDAAEAIQKSLPLQYFAAARIGIVGAMPEPDGIGRVVVATGGTSDIPVAEEAAVTAEALGNEVVRLYDVGVAGLHRMLSRLDDIMDAQAIVAIAGMEGALASVIGGLAGCPVIGVPTSVGYGASFGGVSALLSMLNSCACGVSVVNIDNGFGAGYLASMINHRRLDGGGRGGMDGSGSGGAKRGEGCGAGMGKPE
ncbi:MAG: nickel pincer cofactor biosynthesis protein LarB [Chitinispirillales bacterium]|jgi:NCAIR mutase (PurE)-related protein|nr:nickel pincer cofactor biosynthesis protein LarB [Chitinispirillales bacterium]